MISGGRAKMTTCLMIDTLKGKPADRVPFWFMRQAGRYLKEYRDVRAQTNSFLEFCYSPDHATEVTLQPIRRFGMDAAILFADILVIPDALDQKTWFTPGIGPQLDPITDRAGLDGLSKARLHDHLAPIYETVRRVRAELPPSVALIGFAGAPWTVMTYMIEGAGSRDHGSARTLGYGEPELFGDMLQLVTDATADYLIAQIDAGVDAVQLFDSWAAALPEQAFRQWVLEPAKAIVDRIRAVHSEVPIIGFPRLAGSQLPTYARETGITALGLDTGVGMDFARDQLQPIMPVQGNLDPYAVVAGGARLEAEAENILQALSGGAHVFNLGHGFVPHTPVAHVAALAEQIKAFRR